MIAETEYKKLISAHRMQSEEIQIMHQRLNKAYKIEETCRRQESVIEQLENLIHRMTKERKKGFLFYLFFVNLLIRLLWCSKLFLLGTNS